MVHKQNVEMTCHRRLPIPENMQRFSQKPKENEEGSHHLLNSSCGTIVSIAPGSLFSQSTSYYPCLLSCFQQETQCADLPFDSSADYVVNHPLSGFLSSHVPNFLSFLLKRPNNSVHSCSCTAPPKEINLPKE